MNSCNNLLVSFSDEIPSIFGICHLPVKPTSAKQFLMGEVSVTKSVVLHTGNE